MDRLYLHYFAKSLHIHNQYIFNILGDDTTMDFIEIKDEKFSTSIRLNHFWLRDHCRCEKCYDKETSQRKFNLLDIPLDIRCESYEVKNGILHLKCKYHTYQILNYNLNHQFIFSGPDNHESSFDLDFLYNSQYENRKKFYEQPNKILWNNENIQDFDYARVNLSDLICDDNVVQKVLASLVKYGVAFIEKVPPNVHSTEMAVTRLFPIMKTFFGEMWTFSDKKDHSDFAYTSKYLPAHNDNTYFNDAAGLQILHCIQHEGTGGETLAVDGFKVIENLKDKYPDTYDRLCSKYKIPAEYVESGKNHRYCSTIIKTNDLTGHVEQLRFNMNDRAVLDTLPFTEIQQYYEDLHKLAMEIQTKSNEWWFKLSPGTIFIFDNWRILHGRKEYTGKRVMTGCYVSRTEFLSAARVADIPLAEK